MAYRITATTSIDQDVLDRIRELAYQKRQPISTVIREALESHLDIEDIGKGAKHLRDDRYSKKRGTMFPKKG